MKKKEYIYVLPVAISDALDTGELSEEKVLRQVEELLRKKKGESPIEEMCADLGLAEW